MNFRLFALTLALASGGVVHAADAPDDRRERIRALQRDALRASLPGGPNENVDDRVARLRAIDSAAATLGPEGWTARKYCARAFRDLADRSPEARAALESILDDTSEAFRSPVQPRGAADAWVYAKHGLGQLDDVMKWIEERAAAEPKYFRRYTATPSSMDDAIVAAGRYDLLQHVHHDLKESALRFLTSHENTRRSREDRRNANGAELSLAMRLRVGEFSSNRTSAMNTIERAARYHAGLLASGDQGGAEEVAEALLKSHDVPESRASLAMHAIRAGVAGPTHATWLAEAVQRIPQDIKRIEKFALDALSQAPALGDVFNFDPEEALASLEQAEESDDPALRENTALLREQLKFMIESMRPNDEPPY